MHGLVLRIIPLKKKSLYKIISLSLPLFLLLFLELIFRFFNLFALPPLYTSQVSSNGESFYKLNDRVAERYFDQERISIPLLYPQKFKKTHVSGSLRIVCLGGSSTAGFPYDVNVPFPAQLQMQLKEKWPDKQIDAINLGLSAINSFSIWDWLPEVIDLKPDYVLIYMGHNEFYGAFGSGSAIGIGRNGTLVRFYLRLQHLHIVQALKRFVRLFDNANKKHSTTLMAGVIENSNIETGSAAYNHAVQNFKDNFDEIVRRLQAHHIKTIISTIVSNLKDQPPLENETSHLKNPAAAAYERGQSFYTRGMAEEAYKAFKDARQLDRLRFRAPDTINAIIKSIAAKYKSGFIDMVSAFREQNILPGYKLFSDHLHPNPNGYALIASSFYQVLTDTNPHFPASAKAKNVTPLDWRIGAIRIAYLKSHWPFSKIPFDKTSFKKAYISPVNRVAYDFVFKRHNWPLAHTQMAKIYQDSADYIAECKEYQAIGALYPEHIENRKRLINCAQKTEQWSLVEKECQNILNETERKGEWYFRLALAQFNQKKIKPAFESIQRAIVSPELTTREKAVTEGMLARFLIELGRKKEAQKVIAHIKSYASGN